MRRELVSPAPRRYAGVHRTSFELLQRRAAASCETVRALRGLAAGGLLLRERELRGPSHVSATLLDTEAACDRSRTDCCSAASARCRRASSVACAAARRARRGATLRSRRCQRLKAG